MLLVVTEFHEKCKHTEKILERWRSKHQQLSETVAENFNFLEADEEEEEEEVVEVEEEIAEVANEHVPDNAGSYVDSASDVEMDKPNFVKAEPAYENIEYMQEIENDDQVEYVIIQNSGNDLENLFLQVNSNDAYVVQAQEFEEDETNENDSETSQINNKESKVIRFWLITNF